MTVSLEASLLLVKVKREMLKAPCPRGTLRGAPVHYKPGVPPYSDPGTTLTRCFSVSPRGRSWSLCPVHGRRKVLLVVGKTRAPNKQFSKGAPANEENALSLSLGALLSFYSPVNLAQEPLSG